jgi:molybdate transport system substrate-binding protein
LAFSPKLETRGSYALIPADWHQPLRQRMVRLYGAGAIAEDFYAYMKTEKARAIMRDYGFDLPGF